ncbi:MAG: class I adenylate-forming enzyme family protein [Polyangiaceae bacterium]
MLYSLVARRDDRPAIVRANGAKVTYAELHERCGRLADELTRRGAGPGKAVGVAAKDPTEYLLLALAAWRAGAIVVPLDARAGDALPLQGARRVGVTTLAVGVDETGAPRELPTEVPARTFDPRLGLVLFTSGSSAQPKGVLLLGSGIAHNVEAINAYLPIARFSTTGIVLPLSYSYGLVGQALTTLAVGGTLVILSDVMYPAKLVEAMVEHGVDGLSSVPPSLRLIAKSAIAAARAPKLGYVASAGASQDGLTRDLVKQAFPDAIRFNQYGLTEASPRVTAVSDAEPAYAEGSAGRAIAGVDVFAVDEAGNRLGPGAHGEIAVRGPSVMLGYMDDPEATAKVLSDGTLRSGDAGYVDERGFVFVEGRKDGVVKCGGERVSVEEVAAYMRTAEGVRDAAVIAVPHDDLGNALWAFVEADESAIPALRALSREKLPPAKRPLKFVTLAELPRTSNGKVAIGELKKLAT